MQTRSRRAAAAASSESHKETSPSKEEIGDGAAYYNNSTSIGGLIPGRRTLGPLFLMLVTPNFAIFVWWLIQKKDGDLTQVWESFMEHGCFVEWCRDYPTPFHPMAWKILGTFMGLALLLTRLIPGKMFTGPIAPSGYRNTYHANGVQYYITMTILFILGSKEYGVGLYNGGILYDYYGNIISSLNVFALAFCSMLYIKGITFPSSKDCGTTGNIIFDFYYGTELYPNVLGWDCKQFTNDRFGMMWWAIAPISFCLKQQELNGYISPALLVSALLQWCYLLKFFIWETGYFCTMDIAHDRAGFYICWGCLVWVPSVYTSGSHFTVVHPVDMPAYCAVTLFAIGALLVYINYDADRQRQYFRETNGQCTIWGRAPKIIEAQYKTEEGEVKNSILLASGWWGLARHFHYLPEITAAFCWTPPVHAYVFPYFYTIFLTILLVDRAYRDDARCKGKYGTYWDRYKKLVPYKIIPGIF